MLAALLLLTLVVLWRRWPVAPALLVIPFAFLGLSAVRFIFVFAVAGAPVLARNLAAIASSWSGERFRRPALALAAAGLVAGAASVGLTLAGVPPLADSRKSPGLGVDARFVPEGALGYLDRIGSRGGRQAFPFGATSLARLAKREAIIDGLS